MKCSNCQPIKTEEEMLRTIDELRDIYDKVAPQLPQFCIKCETCDAVVVVSNPTEES